MTATSGTDPRYETFVRDPADLSEGEHVLVLRDLRPGRRKYFASHARIRLSRTPGEGTVGLRVRSMVGNVVPETWFVFVLEALPQRIPGTPYSNAFDALREAWDVEGTKA